jgi:hypothetical protein
MDVADPTLVHSFSSLDEATAAQDALAAAGIPRERMDLSVRQDEAGPVAGNFVIGNGETTHGRMPGAVRTGPEVPYDENFREAAYRGGFLLVLRNLDGPQRSAAQVVLRGFDSVAASEVGQAASGAPTDRDLMAMTQPKPGASPAENREQPPLGEHPSYDDVLDVAVQYTFPCSDPIAVDSCCASAGARSTFAKDTRPPGEGAEPQPADTVSRPR